LVLLKKILIYLRLAYFLKNLWKLRNNSSLIIHYIVMQFFSIFFYNVFIFFIEKILEQCYFNSQTASFLTYIVITPNLSRGKKIIIITGVIGTLSLSYFVAYKSLAKSHTDRKSINKNSNFMDRVKTPINTTERCAIYDPKIKQKGRFKKKLLTV
jgi:hypothetical protein